MADCKREGGQLSIRLAQEKQRRIMLGRRKFIAGTGAALLMPSSPALAALGASRSVALDNLHTGEKLLIEYWQQGQYVQDALAQVNYVLRDFRSGDVHIIDPRLLDLLALLRQNLETSAPFGVISGYRSPTTNALLCGEHEHSGVAAKSLHVQGMAIDIRVGGRSLAALHDAALALRGGGVGYYPASDFVHVDVGRVRRW